MKTALCKAISTINQLLSQIPEVIINIAMRIVIFNVFWSAVQTKITGWTIAGQHFAFWDVTISGWNQFYQFDSTLIANDVAVYLGVFGEFFFSILILLGLFTRFAAVGLFIMTIVIQILLPSAWWTLHVYWALILLYLMKNGGGKFSIDNLICR